MRIALSLGSLNPLGRTAAVALLISLTSGALASDLEDLAREGYAVVAQTRVDGEFEGCEYGRIIRFQNGLALECQTYRYQYGYSPAVLILRHHSGGSLRVIIGDYEFRGIVYRP